MFVLEERRLGGGTHPHGFLGEGVRQKAGLRRWLQEQILVQCKKSLFISELPSSASRELSDVGSRSGGGEGFPLLGQAAP